MANQIRVLACFEGNDREFYEDMAAEQSDIGKWTVSDTEARCDMGVITVSRLSELFEAWGDELGSEEVAELESLKVGDQTEVQRGRGSWYEIEAVA